MENSREKYNYLKYFRVIRYFFKAKYKLSLQDLEMLLFLYSEKRFGAEKFDEYSQIFSWNRNRFSNLKTDGWIVKLQRQNKYRKSIYELSHKGKEVVRNFYRKLEGERIPTSKSSNPLFLSGASYSDKVNRNVILKMNEEIKEIKQRQRHAQK